MMWTIRDSGVPYGPATVSLSVKAMGLLRRLAYLALGLQRSLRMVMQSNSAPLLLYDWRSTSTRQAWENDRMAAVPSRMRSAQAQAVLIAFLVVTLAVSTWMAPPHAFVLHNVLHHLNILPFMLAAMFFGWRGVIKTVLLAAVLQAPSIHRHWFRAPLDAQDQIVELSTFGAAGVIAGLLADRERMQRLRVETTKLELEHVYIELRQNIDQLKKTERLTAAGQLSASLAHEIRNPLASISGAAGILARGQASIEGRAECLEILTKESHRLNQLLTSFLDFARPRLPRLQRIEPLEIVQSVIALGQHSASRQGISLQMQAETPAREVECDPEQIKQLLLNLVLNAIQATNGAGTVVVRTSFTNDRLGIEVCDQGHGVTPEQQEHIFEPFFTTKENGTGLGLAIASNIAAQHGGSLSCAPNANKGTIFRLDMPTSAPTIARRTKAALA
jgi:two-component system, NtrC family, sensor histidine kinase HydH